MEKKGKKTEIILQTLSGTSFEPFAMKQIYFVDFFEIWQNIDSIIGAYAIKIWMKYRKSISWLDPLILNERNLKKLTLFLDFMQLK